MTPPPTFTREGKALSPLGGAVGVVAPRDVVARAPAPAPGAPARRLTPARPAAVIVPPVVVYAAFVLGVAGLENHFIDAFWLFHSLRGVTLAALLLPVVYAFRTLLRGRLGKRASSIGTPLLAGLALLALDVLLPGEGMHVWTLAIAFVGALVLPWVVRAWRESWMQRRPARFTLLAPSEWAAADAVARLEAIPGLKVTTALIPGCNAAEAQARLGLPVASAPGEGAGFERRVIVSCPMRDPDVAATIARLVALGHGITSESAMLRGAEGRVDTLRADPLNLILSSPRHWLLGAFCRLRDAVLAGAALVVLAPLFVAVAFAIRSEDGGPVFYRQRRVGWRGRLFDVIKFRSMRVDAERATGPVWAQQDDPRITRIGRRLRRYRIDELPQLWNVLRGQMSLVGPRPERPHFFDVLRADVPLFELRTMLRPGLTGWAQIRAPYAADANDARAKLEYDLYYVLHRSPAFDLAILLETVGVALGGHGAR
jgi:exopolysaccharide biosynthesis polyprenyl glycosylphosphotransferase